MVVAALIVGGVLIVALGGWGGAEWDPDTTIPTTNAAAGSTSVPSSTALPTAVDAQVVEVAIDMQEVVVSAPESSPVMTLELPWGDGVGEVGKNNLVGPHSIDVTPDRTVYAVNVVNSRV